MKTRRTLLLSSLVVLAALTLLLYIQVFNKNAAFNSVPKITTVSENEKQGVISGRLTFPSESIPENLGAHAINLETYKVYSTNEHLPIDNQMNAYGYKIIVPAGTYYVFGTKMADFTNDEYRAGYAFYDEFMKCYSETDCEKDPNKVKVTLSQGRWSKTLR